MCTHASPTYLSEVTLPVQPSTPPRNTASRASPSPAFSRPPSTSLVTPNSRYPSVRNLSQHPSTPTRSPAAAARQASARPPSTPASLRRAIDTALPLSPPQIYTTPPSSFPSRLGGSVEIHPLDATPSRQYARGVTDSPFDDRHSILVEQLPVSTSDEEDPFEYTADTGARRQKTMPGYTFSHASPTSSLDYKSPGLEAGFMEVRPISEARRSLCPSQYAIPPSTLNDHPDLLLPSDDPPKLSNLVEPIPPTFKGLFYFSQTRDWVLCFLPAFICSCTAALVQPYMSKVIGDVFDVFVGFPTDAALATPEDRARLSSGVAQNTIKLCVAGAAALALNYAKGAFWQRHGEAVVDRLRKAVYAGVQNKSMAWYDLGMGMREEDQEEGESIGAGGLMAKFTRETDDVRLGMATAFGNAVQYFVTFAACFVLALASSPVLALVTLSTIPLVLIIQIITQILVRPWYEGERRAFAEASTNVERATSAITTVKVHNAQKAEEERFERVAGRGVHAQVKQAFVWSWSTSVSDFLLLSTFVVGFWYGAKVVRDGKASPGKVMTVFWACLLGATYLQMVVPQLAAITKAKTSMASLRTVIKDAPSGGNNPFSPTPSPLTATFPAGQRHSILQSKTRPLSMSRIRPARCRGEFNLRNVSFAYPSRPDNPVLRDVTLFIPPGETTFVVGGSGSGKSTIAQLLLRLYTPDGGEITLDDQSFAYLDDDFCREHIAAVQQGCILFDLSIHDNVAMGFAGAPVDPKTGVARQPSDVTRQEVVDACRMAMIHDFVETLPDGYETKLGTGGAALSGGQRQRLAIARARIRDPTVLILDEATSALDATSRVVVFENMKRWRRNKTTIVITHDLSQIVPEDFVYVMSNGIVAEQGFRSDLMRRTPLNGQETGVFAMLAAEQAIEPLAPKIEEWRDRPDDEELLDPEEELQEGLARASRILRPHTPSFGVGLAARPESVAYLDILDGYSRTGRNSTTFDVGERGSQRMSTAQKRLSWTPSQLDRRTSRNSLVVPGLQVPGSRGSMAHSRPTSRLSRHGSYDSPNLSTRQGSFDAPSFGRATSRNGEKEGRGLSVLQYRNRTLSQNLDDDLKAGIEVVPHVSPYASPEVPVRGLFSLMRCYFSTLPNKFLVLLGLICGIGHGISTPIWSFFIAKLMAIVGGGGVDPTLTKWGLVLLAVSIGQTLVYFFQEYFLFCEASKWTGVIRNRAYQKLLKQDKGWFDESANAPARLVQILIKDADDMRQIVGSVMGKIVTFISMVGLGIGWALVVDWRLTLVGLALAPLFAVMMVVQDVLVSKAEITNKARREDLARTFYESVSNVRGIRAMALESTFRKQFLAEAKSAKKTGKLTAWYVAIGLGASAALPLFAQALLNWVGAKFMVQGYFSYPEMIQVFNLVLFSLTFGSAMLDFIPTLAKAKAAARDFERIYTLPEVTGESKGDLRFPITGHVSFSHVQFSYPSRPDVPILTDLSLTLSPGECVAIVGPSGSGKSTIAALLQRLYDPSDGSIIMDKYDLSRADTKWLRNHIAVVSQSANLFDASVSQNIAYGSEVSPEEIKRAAKSANIHDFIMSLPNGYETNLGENASLISGGQAQRLQIARALVRRSHILILDECTSALDVDNQRAILDTIVKIKGQRTTVFITHSTEAMKRCDRIICLGEGVVAEEGTYDDLLARGGVFAHLMQTGEWE